MAIRPTNCTCTNEQLHYVGCDCAATRPITKCRCNSHILEEDCICAEILREEILEDLVETHTFLTQAISGHCLPHQHLDQDDDDYQFVEDGLDRWGDRLIKDADWDRLKNQYPKTDIGIKRKTTDKDKRRAARELEEAFRIMKQGIVFAHSDIIIF